MPSQNTLKRVVPFKRIKVTKSEFEDAECSQCGKCWYFSQQEAEKYNIDTKRNQFRGYAYVFEQDNHGGLQLCQECFDKLKKVPNAER